MFDWVGPGDHVESYVLRRDCPPGIVGSSVVNEYPLLAALHRIGQPVPEPILAEDSYPLIPMPFIITRRLPGRSIGGPLGPGDDRSFDPIPGLAKMLAELHGVPAGELGVPGFSDKPFDRSMLLAHLGYWRDRYLADKGPSSPALDAALVFLEAELESGLQRGVVVHGDPGLYNLLFENDRVVGVVDWELAHFGSAAWDLAYVKEAVEAYGAYERFLNLYESYGGIRPPPRALAYYNVFRLLYCGTMCRNGLAMFNRGEAVGLDLLHVLCTMYPRYLEQLPAAIEAFSQ
jgi:aminoglycoside phosphotransferase (APT) family kinase protein